MTRRARLTLRAAVAAAILVPLAAAGLLLVGVTPLERPVLAQETVIEGSTAEDQAAAEKAAEAQALEEDGAGAGAPATEAPVGGAVPGNTLGNASDSDLWRAIRGGIQGSVSIPDEKAGVLVQSSGESWRAVRNGPLSQYGAWLLLASIVVLAIFFALRGRIRIEGGRSNLRITRFGSLERMAHWLTAVPFVILAITGLNVLYGRYVLLPLVGPEAFSAITLAGKYAHNYVAFAFMLGVLLILVLWIRDNLPSRVDLNWLAHGGGMFTRHSHPPARKFNAGQKILFWLVVLGGISISLSGIALLFPFEFSMFSATFEVINFFGANLPTDLSVQEEMQLSQLWHAVVGLVLTAIIIGHIYIGTIGMEGAFDAMGSGEVDTNWAREHHSLWVEELEHGRSEAGEAPVRAPGAAAH